MMWADTVALSVVLALAVAAAWLIPAAGMRRLMPILEERGKKALNYRGVEVPVVLGTVWVLWALGLSALTAIVMAVVWFTYSLAAGSYGYAGAALAGISAPVSLAVPLVLGSAFLGMIDDLYGDPSARGFRGHLKEMRAGRLTTGGLKMLGIGLLAMSAASYVTLIGIPLSAEPTVPAAAERLAQFVCATLVIALSANFVNLTDLRPGRALKTYGIMAVFGIGVIKVATLYSDFLGLWTPGGPEAWGQFAWGVAATFLQLSTLTVLAFGPLFAVWRFDLGERGMLGDAGANAAGAFAGLLLVMASPLWLLVVLTVVLLALNLVSERVSFSSVIERVRFLRWLDGLGRTPVERSADEATSDAGEDE